MSSTEKLCVEIVEELVRVTPEDFHRFKLMFLASAKDSPRIREFLQIAFDVAALRRPRLIEMKEVIQ